MINISCVSYLNAAPFIYGIRHADFGEAVQLSLDNPAECARKLVSGEADIGLVPVAVISEVPNARVVSSFCIGANGPVQSVTLLGEVPVTDMKNIMLDYQSRTSVALLRILAQQYWKVAPVFQQTTKGYERQITGSTGGVVIGDRSLVIRSAFPFVYDLAEEWKKMTGLPFVFACWVSNCELPDNFLMEFNSALSSGLSDLDAVIADWKEQSIPPKEMRHYLEHIISYELDAGKKQGMELFLNYLRALDPLTA